MIQSCWIFGSVLSVFWAVVFFSFWKHLKCLEMQKSDKWCPLQVIKAETKPYPSKLRISSVLNKNNTFTRFFFFQKTKKLFWWTYSHTLAEWDFVAVFRERLWLLALTFYVNCAAAGQHHNVGWRTGRPRWFHSHTSSHPAGCRGAGGRAGGACVGVADNHCRQRSSRSADSPLF